MFFVYALLVVHPNGPCGVGRIEQVTLRGYMMLMCVAGATSYVVNIPIDLWRWFKRLVKK